MLTSFSSFTLNSEAEKQGARGGRRLERCRGHPEPGASLVPDRELGKAFHCAAMQTCEGELHVALKAHSALQSHTTLDLDAQPHSGLE